LRVHHGVLLFIGGTLNLRTLNPFSKKVKPILQKRIYTIEMRGRGVGTMLLQYLIRYARESGYNTLRLDVIDTNAGARRLYERLGFVALETANFPYLKWALGFAGATQMVYDLTAVG
jgi:predicted GNAT family N-acyltransferase